jgi:hypothetical protein
MEALGLVAEDVKVYVIHDQVPNVTVVTVVLCYRDTSAPIFTTGGFTDDTRYNPGDYQY